MFLYPAVFVVHHGKEDSRNKRDACHNRGKPHGPARAHDVVQNNRGRAFLKNRTWKTRRQRCFALVVASVPVSSSCRASSRLTNCSKRG